MKKVRITYVKSVIGCSRDQKETVRALGLRKLNHSVVKPMNESIRGMLFKVQHLIKVEEVGDEVNS